MKNESIVFLRKDEVRQTTKYRYEKKIKFRTALCSFVTEGYWI